MSSERYRKYLTITAVIALIDLIACLLLVFFIPETNNQTLPPAEKTAIKNEPVRNAIIKTDTVESFADCISDLGELKYNFPSIVKLYTVGYSEAGRELMMVKLGTGPKKALIIGAVHAREHLTTKYLLCCIESYCRSYYSSDGLLGNYNVKELLDSYTLYIIPCANPDGLEIIQSREAPDPGVRVSGLSEYKANKKGVDINRNFPLAWEQINNNVTAPSDYYFKGYEPACAAETQAIMKLCQENTFEFAISYHIKGNCIYWGDKYNTIYNNQYKAFADNLASVSGLYMTEPTEKATDYGGGFENWFRHTYSHPGICVELMKNELTIMPTDNSNYQNFYKTINFEKTVFVTLEAMNTIN